MPSWGIHLALSEKLDEKIKSKDKNLFLFGNILPDINNGYALPNISAIIPHRDTHYAFEKDFCGKKEIMPGYEKFYEENKDKLDNPLVLGYLTHLLSDYYWNDLTYIKHGIFNKNGDRVGLVLNNKEKLFCDNSEVTKLKSNDYKIFTKYIYKNNLASPPVIMQDKTEEVEEELKGIAKIKLTSDDILSTVKYFKQYEDSKEHNYDNKLKEYKIFTEDEMLTQLDKCTEFVINYLEEKNIINNNL